MLKPNELKEKEFELSVLGGYKREDVDDFFAEISSGYEKLYNENCELVQKLKVCVSKIEEYQKDEQFLKSAIINAEKLNENALKDIEEREKQIEQDAKAKADALVENAKLQAENIVSSARAEAADSIKKCEIETAHKIAELKGLTQIEQEKLDLMKLEVSNFKDEVLKIYKKHLDIFSKLPEYHPAEVENVKETSTPEIPEIKEEIPVIPEPVEESAPVLQTEESDIGDEEEVIDTDKTAEFVIEKKETAKSDSTEESFEQNFKFKGLKFGADFDIKKDK